MITIGPYQYEIVGRDGDIVFIEGDSGITHMITAEQLKVLGGA